MLPYIRRRDRVNHIAEVRPASIDHNASVDKLVQDEPIITSPVNIPTNIPEAIETPKPKTKPFGIKRIKRGRMPKGYSWIIFRNKEFRKYRAESFALQIPAFSIREVGQDFGDEWDKLSVEDRMRVIDGDLNIDWIGLFKKRGYYNDIQHLLPVEFRNSLQPKDQLTTPQDHQESENELPLTTEDPH